MSSVFNNTVVQLILAIVDLKLGVKSLKNSSKNNKVQIQPSWNNNQKKNPQNKKTLQTTVKKLKPKHFAAEKKK